MPSKMSISLQKFSPGARALVRTEPKDRSVAGLVKLTSRLDRDRLDSEAERLKQEIEQRGGKVRSWIGETLLMSIEIPIGQLEEIAKDSAVVYIEANEVYGI